MKSGNKFGQVLNILFLNKKNTHKTVSVLLLLMFCVSLILPQKKYYEFDEFKSDLFYYDSKIIENGTVIANFSSTGIYLPVNFITPYTTEIDIKHSKIIATRSYQASGKEKVEIQSVKGIKYFRYNRLLCEYENGAHFEDDDLEFKPKQNGILKIAK